MRRLIATTSSLFLLSASLFISGCALDSTAPPVAQPGVAIQGLVHGGRQGVAGAHVYLLAAGVGTYGGSGLLPTATNLSASLLKAANTGLSDSIGAYVLSGSYGQFSIAGDFTCPAGNPQTYIYTLGGNVGSGENSHAGFLAALGPCNSINSSTNVYVDEISTVISAYAMAGFATDATHVSSSGTPLALTGLTNAFAAVPNLINISTGMPRAKTPNGNGTVPTAEINALANSIASCVNTVVTAGSAQCTSLFADATNDGVACTTPPCANEPTDTASAAINIAHFPSKNVAAIFNLAAGIGAPFQTPLSSAPPDWTIGVIYTGGGLGTGAGQAEGIAIDAAGNLWIVSNYSDIAQQNDSTVLSGFSPLGVPANANGFTGLGLNLPNGVAVDVDSSHVWIASNGNDKIIDFTIANSTLLHSFTMTPSGIGPIAVAIDSAGSPWVANNSSAPWAVKLNPSTGAVATTLSGNQLTSGSMIAFEPGALGNVWVANSGSQYFSLFTNSGTAITNKLIGQQFGVLVDSTGNAWFSVEYNGFEKVNATGTTSAFTTDTGESTNGDTSSSAIDGAGNIWAANNDFVSGIVSDNGIFEFSNNSVNLSGPTGYVPPLISPETTSQPDAIAIDGSGNVWYTSNSDLYLRELIGAATPVTTPVSYATANSKQGSRP